MRKWWFLPGDRKENLLVLFISPFILLPWYRNSFPAQFRGCWWQEGDTAAEPGDAAVSQHLSASHNHWNICRTNILVSHCPGGSRWYMGMSGKWDFPGITVVGECKPAFRVRDSRTKWDLVAVLITLLLWVTVKWYYGNSLLWLYAFSHQNGSSIVLVDYVFPVICVSISCNHTMSFKHNDEITVGPQCVWRHILNSYLRILSFRWLRKESSRLKEIILRVTPGSYLGRTAGNVHRFFCSNPHLFFSARRGVGTRLLFFILKEYVPVTACLNLYPRKVCKELTDNKSLSIPK